MKYINPEWIQKVKVAESEGGYTVWLYYRKDTAGSTSDGFTFNSQDQVDDFMSALSDNAGRFIDVRKLAKKIAG